jgi:hypothetical protein
MTDTTTRPAPSGAGDAMRPRALRLRAEAVGKGKMLILGAAPDKRDAAYQKTAELIDNLSTDLGGADRLSTAEKQLVRHAAVTSVMLEDLASKWLAGEAIDPSLFCTLAATERRLYETCGLRRTPRDVTNDLKAYLAAKATPADLAAGATGSEETP